MVALTPLENAEEIESVKNMVFRHAESTGSSRAAEVLLQWDEILPKFARVIPNDYARVLESQMRNREIADLGNLKTDSAESVRSAGIGQ
jgi:glutamate synthase domain-containing protein 3